MKPVETISWFILYIIIVGVVLSAKLFRFRHDMADYAYELL